MKLKYYFFTKILFYYYLQNSGKMILRIDNFTGKEQIFEKFLRCSNSSNIYSIPVKLIGYGHDSLLLIFNQQNHYAYSAKTVILMDQKNYKFI